MYILAEVGPLVTLLSTVVLLPRQRKMRRCVSEGCDYVETVPSVQRVECAAKAERDQK